MSEPLPTLFVPHGGGPWPALDGAWGAEGVWRSLNQHLRALLDTLPQAPKALLVISAHWEAVQPCISAQSRHTLLYDYGGFPEHTYHLRYDAPGDPALAQRIKNLLDASGIGAGLDHARGLDHGVFVPLMVLRPQADLPVVTLSLRRDLDAQAHWAMGAALAPLREEGVLIIGSGMSFHDLRALFRPTPEACAAALAFDAWLVAAVTHPDPTERQSRLIGWARAPGARVCHPREEHLLPLLVAAAAAGAAPGRRDFSDRVFGLAHSGFRFG